MRDYNFCAGDIVQYDKGNYDVVYATYKYIILKSPFKEIKITKKSDFEKIKFIKKGKI